MRCDWRFGEFDDDESMDERLRSDSGLWQAVAGAAARCDAIRDDGEKCLLAWLLPISGVISCWLELLWLLCESSAGGV